MSSTASALNGTNTNQRGINFISADELKPSMYYYADNDVSQFYAITQKFNTLQCEADLYEAFQFVTKTEITNVNLSTYTYEVNGKVLPIGSMSSAEKVVLLAYISSKTERRLYVQFNGIWIRKDVMKRLIVFFKYTSLLTFVCDNECSTSYFNKEFL